MSVGENIMLPLHEHTELDPATMQIMARMKLEMVNLAGFEDLMPSELSGGMIKRAAVARAIVMDPRILYMDEPSAGLDPVVSSSLDELILLLRDAMGMTIVVVTHELESTFKIADRVISEEAPAFIIAEIGNNHNGSLERAKVLIDEAIAAGADCAKFQMRSMSKLYKNNGSTMDDSADLGTQYTLELLSKFQLSDEYLFEAFKINFRPGLILAIMASFFGISFFNYYWKLMNKVQGGKNK